MSLPEYLDWLLKIGCGWLGWSVEQVNKTHLAHIELAYIGKTDMLRACFGGEDKSEKDFKKISSVDDFKTFFGG